MHTQSFKAITYADDGTRAVTGNMCVNWGNCPLMSTYESGLNMSLQVRAALSLCYGPAGTVAFFTISNCIRCYVCCTHCLCRSLQLDVQGFSHVNTTTFELYHEAWPNKPLVASECCGCRESNKTLNVSRARGV